MNQFFEVDKETRALIEALTQPFSYLDQLADQVRDRSRPKRERTRLQLHLAVLRLAERENIEDIQIEDVIREAAVARGTFYLYYNNMINLIMDAIHNLYETTWECRPPDSLFNDTLSYIFVTRYYSARMFDATPKLFYWYWYLSRRNPDLVARRAKLALSSQNFMIAHLDRKGLPDDSTDVLEAGLRSASLMWNDMQISYFIERDLILCKRLPSVSALTELSALSWYRIVYADDPRRRRACITIRQDVAQEILEGKAAASVL